jgi:hypothetical protein
MNHEVWMNWVILNGLINVGMQIAPLSMFIAASIKEECLLCQQKNRVAQKI